MIRRKLAISIAALAALSLVIAACGSDSDGDDRMIFTPVAGEYSLQVISSDLGVGENRVVIGLLDQGGMPVAGADLSAQFYKVLENNEGELVAEMDLEAITIERSFTHLHDDGELHKHEVGELGVYVAWVDFDTAGRWQVVVSGDVGDQILEPTPFVFEVREHTLSPAVGEPAPPSVQLTLDDVEDISEIDTSVEPIPEMHSMTIAEAVSSGRPSVIIFATPAFCVSQICGPTKEVVDQMYERYGDRINFVHVEPYDVPRARSGDCAPNLSVCIIPLLTDEWGLQSEPWVFTVDAEGLIAGKFDGVVGQSELDEHLQALLAS